MSSPLSQEEIAIEFFEALKDNNLAKIKSFIEDQKLIDPKTFVAPRSYVLSLMTSQNPLGALTCFFSRRPPSSSKSDDTSIAETAQYLIDVGFDVDGKCHWKRSPLHFACRANCPNVVRVLVKNGADVHAVDTFQQNCLFVPVQGEELDCITIVVEHDPTTLQHLNTSGTSLFFLPAKARKPQTLKYMIEQFPANASPTLTELLNAFPKDGPFNPLLVACSEGRYEVAKLLLEQIPPEKNAIVYLFAVSPKTGENALHIACKRDGTLGTTIDLLYLLVEKGGARILLAKDYGGQTPVYKAIEFGDLDNIKRLIALGGLDAVWNTPRDKEGFSPLEYAKSLVDAGNTAKQCIVDFFTLPPQKQDEDDQQQQQQKKKPISILDFVLDPSSDNLNTLLLMNLNSHKPERPPPILSKELVQKEALRLQQEYEEAQRAEEAEYQKLLTTNPIEARLSQEVKFISAIEKLEFSIIKFLIEKNRVNNINFVPTIDNEEKRNVLQILLSKYYQPSSRYFKAAEIAKYLVVDAKIDLFHRDSKDKTCLQYTMSRHFWKSLFDLIFVGDENDPESCQKYVTDADLLDERKTFQNQYGRWSLLNHAVGEAESKYTVAKILARAPQLAVRGSEFPILKAARLCDVEVCKMLFDTNLFTIDQFQPIPVPMFQKSRSVSPFYDCATSGTSLDSQHQTAMEFFLSRGANLFAVAPDTGDTALHYGAKYRFHPRYASMRFLVEKGRIPMLMFKNKKGNTALGAAFLESGNVPTFQFLVRIGGPGYFTKEVRRDLLSRAASTSTKDFDCQEKEGFSRLHNFLLQAASKNEDPGRTAAAEDEDAIVSRIVSLCASGMKEFYKGDCSAVIPAEEFGNFWKIQKFFDEESTIRNGITLEFGEDVQMKMMLLFTGEMTARFSIATREVSAEFSNVLKQETRERETINQNAAKAAKAKMANEAKAAEAKMANATKATASNNSNNNNSNNIDSVSSNLPKTDNREVIKSSTAKPTTNFAFMVGAVSFTVGYIGWWRFQSVKQERSFWQISHGENFAVGSIVGAGTCELFSRIKKLIF